MPRVGPVQSVTDGVRFRGWGFVIYDDIEKPCVTFSYSDKDEAETAHVHVEIALVHAAVTET